MLSSEQLHADIMLLELKFTHGLGDKDFDDLFMCPDETATRP
jgi:hypothetical protein